MASEVWGIDIGKSALKAVKMRRVKNQVEIVGVEIVEYVQTSEEEADREEQIRQALVELKNRTKLKKSDNIFVSIPGQATFNRMITIPPVEEKRIKEIVTYEAQQQIPFPIDEVLWDYQLLGDKKKMEEREVMLFAVRKEIINNFLTNLGAVEVTVQGIQIAPLALYNYIRHDRPELQTSVVIDIGAQNTDLVIVHGDKLWVRALPSAGDDITKALQKKFNIPYEEAEKLKLKAGKTKQAKKIFEVIKPVLKDIVGEIHRSVGYYKSMVKDIKFEKMLFMGNATKLTGFQQFFSQNLQYDVEIISDVHQIRVSPHININLFKTNITSFSVAMGLGIQGLGLASNNIRLLPKEIYIRGLLEKQKRVLIAAVVLLAIAPIWLWIQANGMMKRIAIPQVEITPRKQKLDEFQRQLAEARNYGEDDRKVQQMLTVGKGRERWLELLNAVNYSYNKALEGMKQERSIQPWILDLKIDEKEHRVTTATPQPGITQTVTYRYLEARFKISLDTVGGLVETSKFVERHFYPPLREFKRLDGKFLVRPIKEGEKASTGNRIIHEIELRRKPFPEQEEDADDDGPEKFCHVTIILECWIDDAP